MRGTTRDRRGHRTALLTRLASAVAVALAVTIGVAGAPAQAGDWDCSDSWHYITHGETGRNVRPEPTMHQGNTTLHADAVPGTDYWNQQFLFCRDSTWEPNVYAIKSNLTGLYWSASGGTSLFAGAGPEIDTRSETFIVRRYDSTWWVIQSRSAAHALTPYVAADRGDHNVLRVTPGPLNGGHLFRISPSNLMG